MHGETVKKDRILSKY